MSALPSDVLPISEHVLQERLDLRLLAAILERLVSIEVKLSSPAPSTTLKPKVAEAIARLATQGIEPTCETDDWAVVLNISRREVDRLRSGGILPAPDFHVGRSARWNAATVRAWLEGGKKK